MVLIHGIGGSWRNWLPVLPALEREHEVLAVGLLGHHPERAFAEGVRPSVSALVDGVEREMDEAGWTTAHLVGNSLGGWVALELAKRGRARSVVVLSPGGGYVQGSLSADLTAVRLTLEHLMVSRLVLARAPALVARPRLRRMLFAGTFARPQNIDALEGLLLLRSFGGSSSFIPLLRSMKYGGPLRDLGDISAPVRIGWGTRDAVLPMRFFSSRLREEIPGVDFVELPGLGHVPMVDDPSRVAELILEWTREHGGRTTPGAAASPVTVVAAPDRS